MIIYPQKKRVICPKCNGNKTETICAETDTNYEDKTQACSLCLGEGICIQIIDYKPIIEKQ